VGGRVRVGLLGPIEVDCEGSLGGPKPTTLLALLASHAGSVVTTDQIVDVLWWDRPPANVRATIHTHVSALRRVLGPEAVIRKADGYLLSTERVSVDLDQARRLVADGSALARRGDHHGAVSKLRDALALWRGDHVLGGASGDWADSERARLEDFRLAAYEDLLDAALAVGVVGVPVDQLTALVARYPVRERLRAQLIRTLVLTGRRTDALTCYQAGCRVLADELGVQPGPELQAIWQQLLTADAPPEPPQEPALVPTVPRQLPPDIADFTGRADELHRLTTTPSPIVALFGKPGAGKSALAVHIGHALRDRFPDGELFADLRGTRPAPPRPVDILGQFLRALGVAEAAVPASQDERVALYRSLLAERAVLVLLDDAADEAQVRPLLPSGPNCRCVTTSRARLSTLAGADHVDVQTLTEADALTLLARIVGDQRLAAQTDAAREIVRLCGRLPLAIRVAGARLAARPDWPLARLADRLREQHRTLNELRVGDLEVRGSLNLSYQALSPQQRAALRRVAWLGVPDFSGWLLAALLEVSPADAEDIAERLVDAQLVDTVVGEVGVRYRLHDLTRVFGWERAEDEDQPADLTAAVARVAECCAGLVDRASAGSPARLLRSVLPTAFPSDITAHAGCVDATKPLAWLESEQDVLVHVVERTSELALVGEAARLAAVLCTSSFTNSHAFTHWWRTHSAALDAARRAGDLANQALVLTGLGSLRRQQDRLDEAADYFGQALAAFERIGAARGVLLTRLKLAGTLRDLSRLDDALAAIDDVLAAEAEPATVAAAHYLRGAILTELGRLPEAQRMCELAGRDYHAIGDEHGVALATRATGIVHRAAGRYDQAAQCCERAVAILRAVGDEHMALYATQSLAKARIRQGRGAEVRDSLRAALRRCHDVQDGFGQALMLRTLGELELAAGDPARAVELLETSIRWWTALALPLWRARCQRDLARALTALGRVGDAAQARAEALAEFRRCGTREAFEHSPDDAPAVARRG
jgi:DNA-binding SARP family transcriptional activator/tetratricopeptide (TPR) repeat protein